MTDSKEDPATAAVANNQEEGKKDSGAEEKSDKSENQDEPQNQVWTLTHFSVTFLQTCVSKFKV